MLSVRTTCWKIVHGITQQRQPNPVPNPFPFDGDTLIPFRAGGTVQWRMI